MSPEPESPRRWWEHLPPVGHPLWRMVQIVIIVLGVIAIGSHGVDHPSDAVATGGAGVTGWLVRSLLSSERS